MPLDRFSYAEMRETLRWRVALMIVALITVITIALFVVNMRVGAPFDKAFASVVLGLNSASLLALLFLPRRIGTQIFFASTLSAIVAVVVSGWWTGTALHYWAFLFPPLAVFLLPAWRAMAAMVLFGTLAAVIAVVQLPTVEAARFIGVYVLMICFVTTYALLEERANVHLRELGDRDGLTGSFNRRRFNEEIAKLATPRDDAVSLGVLLADIDHFKAINDSRGHLEGDRVLTATAEILTRALHADTYSGRATLYRYGGEEFAVLVRGRTVNQLGLLAEALRSAVAAGGNGVEPGEVTMSIGASVWRQGAESPEEALRRADEALYEAKRAGRNRVQVSGAAGRISGESPTRHGRWS